MFSRPFESESITALPSKRQKVSATISQPQLQRQAPSQAARLLHTQQIARLPKRVPPWGGKQPSRAATGHNTRILHNLNIDLPKRFPPWRGNQRFQAGDRLNTGDVQHHTEESRIMSDWHSEWDNEKIQAKPHPGLFRNLNRPVQIDLRVHAWHAQNTPLYHWDMYFEPEGRIAQRERELEIMRQRRSGVQKDMPPKQPPQGSAYIDLTQDDDDAASVSKTSAVHVDLTQEDEKNATRALQSISVNVPKPQNSFLRKLAVARRE